MNHQIVQESNLEEEKDLRYEELRVDNIYEISNQREWFNNLEKFLNIDDDIYIPYDWVLADSYDMKTKLLIDTTINYVMVLCTNKRNTIFLFFCQYGSDDDETSNFQMCIECPKPVKPISKKKISNDDDHDLTEQDLLDVLRFKKRRDGIKIQL